MSNRRYDRIQTPLDLKIDESLRTEGTVIDSKGNPVDDAEVILVTPRDESIRKWDKTYPIYLTNSQGRVYHPGVRDQEGVHYQGRVRQPLEHVMARSNGLGQFALYPPKGENFFLVALHPDGGVGFAGREQFTRDHKIDLLEWATLESEFSKEPEQQDAVVETRVPKSGDIPEIVFRQYWTDMGERPPTLHFAFAHVPPNFQTTISRLIGDKFPGMQCLPGASVDLLPGETRRLDLGPLTEQQRKRLREMQHPELRRPKVQRTTEEIAPNSIEPSAPRAIDVAEATDALGIGLSDQQRIPPFSGNDGSPACARRSPRRMALA